MYPVPTQLTYVYFNVYYSHYFSTPKSSVADPDDFGPDPDVTFEKTRSGSDPSKMRIRIMICVKFCTNFL
jgi:hypothetical protein